ncbi:MAG: hypothetical protein HY331_11465 [Chloroflexi bacterium]|nr:hypothetical protein [Chloroflexota bacterium]
MPLCEACGAGCGGLDNYCRNCGVRLRADPVDQAQTVALVPPPLSVGEGRRVIGPWLAHRPGLVRGLVALGTGAAVEILRRRLVAGSIGLPELLRLLRPQQNGRREQPSKAFPSPGEVSEDVLETIVIRWRRKR